MEKLESGAAALGLHLTPRQLQAFAKYYEELVAWNRRVNLTAVTDRDEVQVRHFLDSLTVLLTLPGATENAATCDGPLTLIDVGTGAGFPGVPLRIVCPNLSLTLLEATTKRVVFLGHLLSVLGLSDVSVIDGRAEDVGQLPEYRERFDIVVARAVARLPILAELCLPLARVGGRVIAMKGPDIKEEVDAARRAITTTGGILSGVRTVEVGKLLERRTLVVIDKVSPTPAQYPRRPGIPAKRPL
ncbi:MAG: 16S rRNA (guanine(527)-N(7))-methyltransferase RsmG [Chloroflexota bacterium]